MGGDWFYLGVLCVVYLCDFADLGGGGDLWESSGEVSLGRKVGNESSVLMDRWIWVYIGV